MKHRVVLLPAVPVPVGGGLVSIEAGRISTSMGEGTCAVVDGVTLCTEEFGRFVAAADVGDPRRATVILSPG